MKKNLSREELINKTLEREAERINSEKCLEFNPELKIKMMECHSLQLIAITLGKIVDLLEERK